jgi:hypothetical protein
MTIFGSSQTSAARSRRRWSPRRALGERLNRVIATAVSPQFEALDDRVRAELAALSERIDEPRSTNQPLQRLLALRYGELQRAGALPHLRDVGFRVYSQADEDGILLYIFSLIGTETKRCVELAFGTPHGANTTNLLCNWGWTGLLIEGDESHVHDTTEYFRRHPDTWYFQPTVVNAWVTKDNINAMFAEHGFSGEIDLLSLDVDGNDWWFWRELEVVRPRVVVVEYNNLWGSDRAVTVPYRPNFVYESETPTLHIGASLLAFVKLAREKGYRLVGSNRYDYNAFFVADGEGEAMLPSVAVDTCLTHPAVINGQREVLPLVENLEWIDV